MQAGTHFQPDWASGVLEYFTKNYIEFLIKIVFDEIIFDEILSACLKAQNYIPSLLA